MISPADWRRVVLDWNQTSTDYPRTARVQDLFEAQAHTNPEALAVAFQGRHLSYGELNQRANQLAHHLIRRGIAPETMVGLAMQRGIEMVVGMLGVLKAGAAYVPLDPSYPASRLSMMLRDTRTRVVLAQEHLERELPDHECAVVRLDRDWSAINGERADNPTVATTAESLAYVMYTSGSTGRPKGTCIPHRAIVRLVRETDFVQLGSRDRVAQAANASFDAVTFEVWGPLLTGGQVVVLERDVALSPERVAEAIEEHGITALFLTTVLFNHLAVEKPGIFEPLEHLLFGGEAVNPSTVRSVLHDRPPRRLLHVYGPTENTTFSTWHLVDNVPEGAHTVPIGHAIANSTVYVLDENLEPAPIGVPGELYTGGDGLARGYLNNPALTAERFVPNPFGSDGSRLYRTGDRVQWTAAGAIEFLGRFDHQVKVRGFRIELGEIEAALLEHPAVHDAVVTAPEDGDGGRRLVSFVACESAARQNEGGLARALREHLEARLPAYMVPAPFVMLEALPLTPNGKVDRGALVDPGRGRSQLSNDFVAPRTQLERKLVDIWCRVLNVAHIGASDSFWELGGDSILAATVINEIQAEIGAVVHVAAIFDAPTVTELAAYLEQHYSDSAWVRGRHSRREPADPGVEGVASAVDAAQIGQLRELIPSLPPLDGSGKPTSSGRNPTAIFVLAPPRSGSSLFRIMLGGHPALFAPPELELLSFDTLAERRMACSGRYSFMREGTIRALMELRRCSAQDAKKYMEEYEERDLTAAQFYRVLQDEIGNRTLVDKTAVYPLDIEALRRAEAYFDGPRYLWLRRHPCGMIRSFEEARLDLVLRFRHPFTARQLAELLWYLSYENIREFLRDIPADRQLALRFEDLVRSPEKEMAAVCDFLGLELHPDMVDPYRRLDGRMTDGLYQVSRPISDPKFHEHRRIDPSVADRWQGHVDPESLADMTRELAGSLGYPLGERTALEPIARIRGRTTARDVDEMTDAEVEAALAALLRQKELDGR